MDQMIGRDNLAFEIEMRTAMARMTAQLENLTSQVRNYLEKTQEQEVKISRIRSEIDTLFHDYGNLRQDIQSNKEEISKVIDDKIDSIYKLAAVIAFLTSTAIAVCSVLLKQ